MHPNFVAKMGTKEIKAAKASVLKKVGSMMVKKTAAMAQMKKLESQVVSCCLKLFMICNVE